MIFLSVSFLLIITLNRHYDDFGAARSHLDKKELNWVFICRLNYSVIASDKHIGALITTLFSLCYYKDENDCFTATWNLKL